MDDHINTSKDEDGLVYPYNEQLGVFTNPLPPSQIRGYIGTVSTSNCLTYYFANKHECRNGKSKCGTQGMEKDADNDMFIHHPWYGKSKIKGTSLCSYLCKMHLGRKNLPGMQSYWLKLQNCTCSIY